MTKRNKPETILVTGAGGQLGSELRELSNHYPQYRFLFTTKEDLPVDNPNAIQKYFESQKIDYVINCAAYTAVDKAETDREAAFRINGDAPGYLAEICKEHKAKLIQISTDYVFDGTSREPLKEEDTTTPINIYGESKLKGEQMALAANAGSLIIRTAWVYSSYGNNFLKTMMRLMAEKESLNIVADQMGAPTYAADIAKAIMAFVDNLSEGNDYNGIFHYSNSGITTWYQYAQFIKEKTETNCILNPVSTLHYPTPARRPLYSVLDTSKISKVPGIEIPFWKESVSACIEKILNDANQ